MTQNVNYDLNEGAIDFTAFEVLQRKLKIQVYFTDLVGTLKLSVKESTEEDGEFVEVEDSVVEIESGTTSFMYTWETALRGTFAKVCISDVAATGTVEKIVVKV